MPGAVNETPHATRIWNGTDRKKGPDPLGLDSDDAEDIVEGKCGGGGEGGEPGKGKRW